jgi:hypothetical protein
VQKNTESVRVVRAHADCTTPGMESERMTRGGEPALDSHEIEAPSMVRQHSHCICAWNSEIIATLRLQ